MLISYDVKKELNKSLSVFKPFTGKFWGTRWRSWLRHCAISQKVAGSIPDCVIGIFN